MSIYKISEMIFKIIYAGNLSNDNRKHLFLRQLNFLFLRYRLRGRKIHMQLIVCFLCKSTSVDKHCEAKFKLPCHSIPFVSNGFRKKKCNCYFTILFSSSHLAHADYFLSCKVMFHFKSLFSR